LFFVYVYSILFIGHNNVNPGEIFAIKVDDCPKIKADSELILNFEGSDYAILPAPYSKE